MRTVRDLVVGVVLTSLALISGAGAAEAQPTVSWQLAPLCNSLTLTVVGDSSPFTVSGFIDTCGADTLFAAFGSAFVNPNGTLGVGLTTVFLSGYSTSLYLVVDLATLSGTWTNPIGESGTLVLQ
jgi:hypothetical protein